MRLTVVALSGRGTVNVTRVHPWGPPRLFLEGEEEFRGWSRLGRPPTLDNGTEASVWLIENASDWRLHSAPMTIEAAIMSGLLTPDELERGMEAI